MDASIVRANHYAIAAASAQCRIRAGPCRRDTRDEHDPETALPKEPQEERTPRGATETTLARAALPHPLYPSRRT